MTPATVSAAALKIRGLRKPPQFQSLANEAVNLVADVVHGLLRLEKSAGDRVVQKRLALTLEFLDLLGRQLQALMLLVMKVFALLRHADVLGAGLVIDEELINPKAMRLKFRLRQDGAAKFFEFRLHWSGKAADCGV
jgi:hypothetical protein